MNDRDTGAALRRCASVLTRTPDSLRSQVVHRLLRNRTVASSSPSTTASGTAMMLVRDMAYELVPMKSAEAAIEALPVGCPVSVTCSPAKGLAATFELTTRLMERGHHVVPHISARLVESSAQVNEISGWLRLHHIREVFLVGGDVPHALGPYGDTLTFLRALLDTDHRLTRIGITAYPDGHALIDDGPLRDSLHAKQKLLSEATVAGYATTQMCFDAQQIRRWLGAERAAGFTLPIHLGIPGVIDRAKLLTMGMRLGIGNSLRFVKKNGGTITRLFSPTGYDPAKLVTPVSTYAEALGVEGLHTFTFNNVAATAEWQRAFLARSNNGGTRTAW